MLHRYYTRQSLKDAAVTQQQLNNLYTGPDFTSPLPDRYAAVSDLLCLSAMP